MRTLILMLTVVDLTPVALMAADSRPSPAPATAPADAKAAPAAIGVNTLVADPKKNAGVISVTGVVARVFPKTGAFTLIDTQEFAECNDVNCAEVTLPIQTPDANFTGDLPAVKDTVIVTGTLTPKDKGFTLEVTSVTKNGAPLRTPKPPAGKAASAGTPTK